MKHLLLIAYCMFSTLSSIGQTSRDNLTMTSDYGSENSDVQDILRFEGIYFYKIAFTGQELRTKSYSIRVKEMWDGKCVRDSLIINTYNLPFESLATVNDTVLKMKVLAKHTHDNKIKMTFGFDRFSVTREFDAIDSDDYSLRNIPEESGLPISYDDKFYLLAYILPYEMEDGSKSWCEVGSNGKDIENWGEKFGIKHYLLFDMEFTDYVAPERAD